MARGKTYTFPDGSITLQVQEYVADVGSSPPYAGVLVKACVKKMPAGTETLSFSWTPWSLYDADDGRYKDAGVSGGDLPQPTYPNGDMDGTFAAGDCTKGWMFFKVPKGTDIAEVRYTNPNDPTISTRWSVS